LIVLSVVCAQLPVGGRITLWPAKLNIDMERFPDEPIVFKRVQIKNPENSAVVVRAEVSHPNEESIEEGFSFIPDLSWVSVTPKEMTIPAKSDGFFNIIITIPKGNQSQSYNQKWEVLAVFYQKKNSEAGAVNFLVKLGSRVFINTPDGDVDKQQASPNLFVMVWFIGMAGLAVAIVALYLRGRYSRQKAAVFYVKDKHQKYHKRK